MKKIPVFKIFCSTCLLAITASAISAVIIYDKKFPYYSKDEQQNYTSEVTWDGAYHLGVDDNPDFVTSPTQQSIAAALHDQFPAAFPSTNDFTIQIAGDKQAIATANSYSTLYSGTTNITWDVEQKLNLPSSVLLSPFYTQGNTMYENEDVTEQMVFDKLVSEYSNSLNINQLLLTQRNDITGEFTVQPKADSTVYNTSSQLNAQINVTQSAVLTYTKTIITSGTDSGAPTFTYRGSTVTATYTIVSTPAAPISFSNNKLVYAADTEYAGGLFVITGSYTTGGNTYTASWSIFCQKYDLVKTFDCAVASRWELKNSTDGWIANAVDVYSSPSIVRIGNTITIATYVRYDNGILKQVSGQNGWKLRYNNWASFPSWFKAPYRSTSNLGLAAIGYNDNMNHTVYISEIIFNGTTFDFKFNSAGDSWNEDKFGRILVYVSYLVL